MSRTYTIHKDEGETPLEALIRLRAQERIPDTIPLAYAGRLDPLASGKLLVLAGDECKRQSHYHGLDKAYDFEILLGFSSDTGDILGLPRPAPESIPPSQSDVTRVLSSLGHTVALPYPHYSSKTVRGKPLFLWTLEGRLHEIEVPTATTQLYNIEHHGSYTISAPDLQTAIHSRIQKITPVTEESKALGADFRRVPILASWDTLLADEHKTFTVLKMRTICSSGTYIRSLAPHIASRLHTAGLAYSIKRTHIGRYHPVMFTRTGFWFPNN